MFELNGKYANAKIFTELVDEASISQVMLLLNQEFAKDQKIRMMPDIHAGAGCTIGTTMTISDKIVPNLVGVDIGCGMLTVILGNIDIDCAKLDDIIHQYIPAGMEVRKNPHPFVSMINLDQLRCKQAINLDRAYLSIGTLGGGNHFCEIDIDSDENKYLVIHSGSRYLGKQIAEYYQDLAYSKLNRCTAYDIQTLVEKLKTEGKQKQINDEIKKLKSVKRCSVPKELAYLEGSDFDDYIHDMTIAQKYAQFNREAIAETILSKMNWQDIGYFTTVHNYIDTEHMILRKGAVAAYKGQKLLIPINMLDGSLVCVGLGNNDWNCSAPHGAGRLLSRREAKDSISLKEYCQAMSHIYSTSVSIDTIDEAPMAYKPMSSILDNIGDTVEVIDFIKPIYNFKASSNNPE